MLSFKDRTQGGAPGRGRRQIQTRLHVHARLGTYTVNPLRVSLCCLKILWMLRRFSAYRKWVDTPLLHTLNSQGHDPKSSTLRNRKSPRFWRPCDPQPYTRKSWTCKNAFRHPPLKLRVCKKPYTAWIILDSKPEFKNVSLKPDPRKLKG